MLFYLFCILLYSDGYALEKNYFYYFLQFVTNNIICLSIKIYTFVTLYFTFHNVKLIITKRKTLSVYENSFLYLGTQNL